MIFVKLPFRVAAFCLAAVLVLGMLPSGAVYADDDLLDAEIVEPVEEAAPQDISVEVQGDGSVSEQTKNTEPNVEVPSSGNTEPSVETPFSGNTEPSVETPSSGNTEPSVETPSSGNTESSVETPSSGDTEQKAEAPSADDPSQETSDSQQEENTADEPTDASAIDMDALTAWVQEHPEQLSALYQGDETAISALAEALNAKQEAVRTYVSTLKEQNELLVKALENGTDVLNIISFNTSEDAAETLGVDTVAIDLFDIKLNYVSKLLSSAMEEAEENGQEEALYQELGEALGDEDKLSQLASSYDVEPAVLGALLQTMGIEAIADSSPSITLTTVVLEAPEGSNTNFLYKIFLWNNNASGSSRAVTGTRGDGFFTSLKLDADTAVSMALPIISYGYNYYGYGTVYVPAGASVTISNLPEGCGYYVLSSASSDYYIEKLTATEGTVDNILGSVYVASATGHNEIECTNTYAPNSLRLGEEVVSSNSDSFDEVFEFTVYFYKHGEDADTPLFDQDLVQIPIETHGSDNIAAPNLGSAITFSKISDTLPGLGISGVYNVGTVKLRHGQSVVFKDLGQNYGYYIVQTPNIHYMVENFKSRYATSTNESQENFTGYSYDAQYMYLDECDACYSLTFVNAQEKLSITKKVVNSDTTRSFVFNVFFAKISADTGKYTPMAEGTYKLTYTGGTGSEPTTVNIQQRSDISHTPWSYTDWYRTKGTSGWSVAQIQVAAGQTVTIEGLPEGIVYDIVEVPVANYTVSATAVNGTVGSNGNVYSPSFIYDDASATFTNTYVPPVGNDLTVAKFVTGNMGNTDQAFSFYITLTDQNGSPLSSQDIQVLLPGKSTATVYTTDASGGLTLNLKHDQEATLKNLPQGTRYTITESGADYYTTTFTVDGGTYDTPVGRTQSGAMTDSEDVSVLVTNDLTIIVPTGIRTEVQPFLVLLALSLVTLLLMILGKRRNARR
jgi:hypothetical protein